MKTAREGAASLHSSEAQTALRKGARRVAMTPMETEHCSCARMIATTMATEDLDLTRRRIRTADFAALAASTIVISKVLALLVTGCDATPAPPTGDDTLGGLGSNNHAPDDTRLRGCVLYKDMDISEGQDIWDEFVSKSKSGEACTVRLAFYVSPPKRSRYSPGAYNEARHAYQAYRFAEIRFSGATYHYYYNVRKEEYTLEYGHLMRYSGTPMNPTAPFSQYVYYVLVNNNTLPWKQIEFSMACSKYGAAIDYQLVYSARIYK
jgi:hypothetical protein